MKKRIIVVGITSGIAAYKSIELVKLLRRDGYTIFVVMTKHATRMVDPKKFEEASGNKVYSELFEQGFSYKDILKIRKVDHIKLADAADVVVIAPATANIIAKIAHGIADDFLTTTLLAVHCPVIICPSMNVNMWSNPIVQENISGLKALRYHIVDPEKGMLACGYEGKGRLAYVQTIKDEVIRHLQYRNSLAGKKIIVTAGGTLEKIDDVRYITNRSSGKMGIAIAEECFVRGADVVLLRARNAVTPRYTIPEKTFTTSDELFVHLKETVPNSDILFHVAAISDFRLAKSIQGKITSDRAITIKLQPTEKIVNKIRDINQRIKLIAFKAECNQDDSSMIQIAYKKLEEVKADAIIANDVGKEDQSFESDFNEVIIVFPDGTHKKVQLASKRVIAKEIIDTLINKSVI